MQAIEFEATAHDHLIRIPDTAPDGVPLRVILLVDEPTEKISASGNDWKPDVGAGELPSGKTLSPITQSLIGLLANAKFDELDYKKHLEDKYL